MNPLTLNSMPLNPLPLNPVALNQGPLNQGPLNQGPLNQGPPKPGAPPARTAQGPGADQTWQAARAFEAMALGAFLKPMFETAARKPGLFSGGEGEKTWKPMLIDEIGKQIAAAGLGPAGPIHDAMLRMRRGTGVMPEPLIAAAARLAGVLERENAALAAMDLPRAAALLEEKTSAFAVLTDAEGRQAQTDVDLLAIARRLSGVAAENRRLLERALTAQQLVLGIVARAMAGALAAEPGYGAAGRPAGRTGALALSTRA